MTVILGIDPGFKGALAFLDPDDGRVAIFDMPKAPNASGKNEIDHDELYALLDTAQHTGPCISLLETVATRPGEGTVSAFRFGQGYGAIQMALAARGWVRHSVTPPKWKKHFGLIDKNLTQAQKKKQSIVKARQLYPQCADQLKRISVDDGRAEALLIATYARQTLL